MTCICLLGAILMANLSGGAPAPGPETSGAPAPTQAEMAQARAWADSRFSPGAAAGALPFSFVYDGRPSGTLLPAWARHDERTALDAARTQHTITWTDAATGLEVRCVEVTYRDFPAVEWTVYFRNTGAADTPILENLQGLDVRLERGGEGEYVLHGIQGDSCTPDSYEPYDLTLGPNTTHRFAPVGGRPTNGAFPYYDLQEPGGGLIFAVGWPGQWATSFERDGGDGLRIRAGQALTHLLLHPGEEVRTPLIVLLFWRGTDRDRAQNLWRRWMIAHNMPHPHGRPPRPMLVYCDGGFYPGLKVSAAIERRSMDVLTREGIKLDYWWMDAGWYPCTDWAQGVGTWEPDPARFPHGIKEVSDYAHAHGAGLILWFEPERVMPGTWIAEHHPEWCLGDPHGTMLLNLGDPAARAWLTDHVDGFIRSQGIDLYRQDFNLDPLPYWRAHDTPDRQGMTENLDVQGYLAYWDELRRRHPNMLIDSCASGGRRNDLETLRRAVPLLRSDYQSFSGDSSYAPGNQGHTYGLSSWLPYYGQGVYYSEDHFVYCVRSYLSPAFGIAVDVRRKDIDWDLYRRMVSQWRQVADCFLGNYYPLTGYSLSADSWMAWQFDLPAEGRGMVQAFRHTGSPYVSARLNLHGLDATSTYEVRNLDEPEADAVRRTGRELMAEGLLVEVQDRPGAVVLTYRKVQ